MQSLLAPFRERLGLSAFAAGDYVKAEKYFRKLEEKDPNSLSVLRNLGLILMAKGDAEGAEAYLLREEKLYGRSFHRHAALADIAYARGRRKEAEKRYRLALAEPEAGAGGSATALRPLMEKRLGICSDEKSFATSRESMMIFQEAQELKTRGEAEKAVEAFLRSAALDESNWPALNNAGILYLESLGKPDEALKLFERAFDVSRNIHAARNIEVVKRRLGKKGGR
jgi:tetratricopeptide (TPR) repeat protein